MNGLCKETAIFPKGFIYTACPGYSEANILLAALRVASVWNKVHILIVTFGLSVCERMWDLHNLDQVPFDVLINLLVFHAWIMKVHHELKAIINLPVKFLLVVNA